MTNNQLTFQRNAETRRHNLEQEKEQEYANLSGRIQAQAGLGQAAAAYKQANVAEARAVEEAAHNRVSEKQNAIKIGTDFMSNATRPLANKLVATLY